MQTKEKTKKKHNSFCTVRSLSKMIIWMHNGSIITRYSFLASDKKGTRIGIEKFEKMLKSPTNVNRWKSAIIYDNQNKSKPFIEKYYLGKRLDLNANDSVSKWTQF